MKKKLNVEVIDMSNPQIEKTEKKDIQERVLPKRITFETLKKKLTPK